MFTSISASVDSIKAFAKILALGSSLREKGELKDKEKLIKTYLGQAEEFLTDFQIRKPLFNRIVQHIIDNDSIDHDEDFAKDLKDFAKILSKKKSKLERDVSIRKPIFKYIYSATNYMLRGADTNLKYVVVNANLLSDPSITTLFKSEVHDVSKVSSELEALVESIEGEPGLDISKENRKLLRDNDPDKLKALNKARSKMLAIPKNFIRNHIRESGESVLRVRDLKSALDDAGITHTLPDGFVGYMDEDMGYYNLNKVKLHGTPAGDVLMNKDYDPNKDNGYVCKAKAKFAQDYTAIYTVEFKRDRIAKKFEAVRKFAPEVEALRYRWLSEMRKGVIDSREGIAAMICEIVYQTSGRVGSTKGSTAGKKTYGISVLTVGQYKKRGNNRLMEYIGKKGQPQKHLYPANNYVSKQVIRDLDTMAEGKTRKEHLITYKGKPLSNKAINDYLKSIGAPDGITIHKFRTLKATSMTESILSRSPLIGRKTAVTSKQANDWLTKALEQIAKELGHFSNGNLTVNTAIANYIDPSLLEDFFKDVGARPNTTIQKAIDEAKGHTD